MLHGSEHKNNNLLADKFHATIRTLKQMVPSCTHGRKKKGYVHEFNYKEIIILFWILKYTLSWSWSLGYVRIMEYSNLKGISEKLCSSFSRWLNCCPWQKSNSLLSMNHARKLGALCSSHYNRWLPSGENS